ncbi:MAG: beta-N-acetylhexosaminidase [Clostridia bacterium]|nr:beta-N-acetylhexosaminidase [Clostridia bacterium]
MSKIPFKRFGVMPDLSRNAVMDIPTLKRFAKTISEMGYNTLLLYTEDTYEVPGEPYFGHHRGRYSQDDIRDLVAYCETIGVEVIPCIQTLAHLEAIFKWVQYRNTVLDTGNILLAEDERTYELIRNMLKSIKACYKSRVVHVGMDEAHLLGAGKYQSIHGYKTRFEILSRHLEKVCEMCRELDLEPQIWGDMFFRLCNDGAYFVKKPNLDLEKIGELPDNLSITAWDYYKIDRTMVHNMIAAHQKLGREVWYGGGIWTWKGYAPDNRFSIRCSTISMEECMKLGVENYFITMWCEAGGGTSRFAGLPALYACSRIARGEKSMKEIARGFEEKFGISYHRFLDLDLTYPRKYDISKNAGGGNVCNPETYLLFNDPLFGKYDAAVTGAEAPLYQKLAKRLAKYRNHPEYGYLFRSQAALARTLSRKVELTIRTREAYLAGDKAAMTEILTKDYPYVLKNLKEFITSFRALWLIDNRPQGLEVQEARLGGLYTRLVSCRARLQDWVDNGTPIPELEEPVLDFRTKGLAHLFKDGWGNWITAGRT